MAVQLAAPSTAPLTGTELRAIREAHGWSRWQVARALHYSDGAVYAWEAGTAAVPPAVAQWARALPPVRRSGSYPPTCGGLRVYLLRHDMHCRELAEFCGVAESTVERWVRGESAVPLPLRAWLAAGAPPNWAWAPPELASNIVSLRGKRRDVPAVLPPQPPRQRRRGPSRLLARLFPAHFAHSTSTMDAPPSTQGQRVAASPRRSAPCVRCDAPSTRRRRGRCPACYVYWNRTGRERPLTRPACRLCDRPHHGKGLCKSHYQAAWRARSCQSSQETAA